MLLGRWGAALVVLAAVTACGDAEPGAASLPPVSPVPSVAASVSASPSAALVPSAAGEATPQGAAEFARFWFDVLNQAAAAGETTALRRLGQSSCVACARFADSIDGLYGPGGGIEGGVFTLRAAESPALAADAPSASVTVIYDVSPTRQLAPDGSTLQQTPALTGVVGEMRLHRELSGWSVVELTVQ